MKFVPLTQKRENIFRVIPSRFEKFKYFPGGVSEQFFDISCLELRILIFRLAGQMSFLAGKYQVIPTGRISTENKSKSAAKGKNDKNSIFRRITIFYQNLIVVP